MAATTWQSRGSSHVVPLVASRMVTRVPVDGRSEPKQVLRSVGQRFQRKFTGATEQLFHMELESQSNMKKLFQTAAMYCQQKQMTPEHAVYCSGKHWGNGWMIEYLHTNRKHTFKLNSNKIINRPGPWNDLKNIPIYSLSHLAKHIAAS